MRFDMRAMLAIGALATGGVERTWLFGAGAVAMGLGSAMVDVFFVWY